MHKIAALLIITVQFGFLQPALAGKVYKWTDENGQVHFTEYPPQKGSADSVDLKINSYSSVSYQSAVGDRDSVLIYTTSWCGYCKKARAYFKKNNIAYTEIDIEQDAAGKRAYDQIGGTGVPVILFGDQRMNGFSVAGFERIYGQN